MSKEDKTEVMVEMELRDAEFDSELNVWLDVLMRTSVQHLEFMEAVENKTPEAITDKDYRTIEIERGFLVLYALHIGGKVSTGVTSKEVNH